MTASDRCYELIKKYEGCYLSAYRCPSGILTIGYGHTGGVKQGQTITKKKALEYLEKDVAKFEKVVMKYNKTYNFNQSQFDSLVSFAFNIGNIDKLTNNGKRAILEIADYMLKYNKDNNGNILNGLVNRRKEERALFMANNVTVNAKSGLNLREQPTTTSKIKNTLQNGKEVVVLETWSYVDTGTNRGWVSTEYLKGV